MSITALKPPPKRILDLELGPVRYCPDCQRTPGSLPFSPEDAYWPEDTEFFHASGNHNGGFNTYCIACYNLRRASYYRRDHHPLAVAPQEAIPCL